MPHLDLKLVKSANKAFKNIFWKNVENCIKKAELQCVFKSGEKIEKMCIKNVWPNQFYDYQQKGKNYKIPSAVLKSA